MSSHPTKTDGLIWGPWIFPDLVISNFTEMHGCPFQDSVLVVNLIYKESKISTCVSK